MHLTRTLSLSAAALVAALSLTACSDDSDESKKADSSQASQAADASDSGEQDPQAVVDAANAWYASLVNETLAAVEAEVGEDDMADFAAFVDEWFPETSGGLAWDTFASEVHAYATLRSIIGVAMLAIGLSEDPAASAEELLTEENAEADWVTFDGDVASVQDPETPGEDSIPVNMIERDGVWLLDGTVFSDEWFEQQGTTAEEALNS